MASKKKKIRADFRKNREVRVRQGDLTRGYQEHGFEADETVRSERVSGKGSLSRKRTIMVSESETATDSDAGACRCRRSDLSAGHGVERGRTAESGADVRRPDLSVRHAAVAEDHQHRSAKCRGGRRPVLISPRRQFRRDHRTRRTSSRRALPYQPRSPTRDCGQRRSAVDRRQRGGADVEAQSDRSSVVDRRKVRRFVRSCASTRSTSSIRPICNRWSASTGNWVIR